MKSARTLTGALMIMLYLSSPGECGMISIAPDASSGVVQYFPAQNAPNQTANFKSGSGGSTVRIGTGGSCSSCRP